MEIEDPKRNYADGIEEPKRNYVDGIEDLRRDYVVTLFHYL